MNLMDLSSDQERILSSPAGASRAPERAGPDCMYGGEWFVTMGGIALCTGHDGEFLAKAIAARWNAALPQSDQHSR